MKNNIKVGAFAVDPWNLGRVVKCTSIDGAEVTYKLICTCLSENYKKDAKLIAELLERNRKKIK